MQYSLERKKLKYFLKHGILNFNKSRIRNSKKKKWFRLKNRTSRKKFLLKRFKKSKLFPRIFLKRNFRDTMLIFKKIRGVFMDNRKKALRRFFSKNTDLMFTYQNKLKYSLKDSFFVESFYSAKQHIKHKRIFVNGVLVTDPNFLLKNTDIVSLKNRGKTKTKIKYFTKCWQVNDKKPLRNGLIISYQTASFNFFFKKRDDLSLEEKNWLLLRKKTLSKLKYV